MVSVKVCTQKAQQDLRYEEDIDAFSMNGDTGRVSPLPHHENEENGTILIHFWDLFLQDLFYHLLFFR